MEKLIFEYPKGTDLIFDHVPVKRHPAWACYDNKKLSRWDADDFSEFVFDQCNTDFELTPGNTFIHNHKHINEYIKAISYQKDYQRVYLYGVFTLVKDYLQMDKKLNKK